MHNKMRRLMEHMGRRERIGQKAIDYGFAELPNFSFYKPGDPAPAPRELPANFDAEWADGELPPEETLPTFELDPAPTP